MNGNEKQKVSAVILAAGKGKRMKADVAKVMHPLCGKPMLAYSVDAARAVNVEKIVVIIGHQAGLVREAFKDQGLIFVEQLEQLGTGHAVLQARDVFHTYNGTILILCGDVPMLSPSTIRALLEVHILEKSIVTVLTTILDDPSGYGRVIKEGEKGEILRIVEEKDASLAEKRIKEINTGIYCVESNFLFRAVGDIGNENIQKEYYLTDIVGIAWKKGFKTRSFITANSFEVMGINTPDDLEKASERMTICK
jgi:UDP-N-acetylglucosamine diphosphorylase/glucosamine-1-phosphate N-acetyltransferase